MKKKILKLGTIVTDSVTGLKGMLTVYIVDMENNQNYLFQPSKLNPETKEPVDTFWLTGKRITDGELVNITPQLEKELEILGTIAEDKATGFKGTVTDLFHYLNGCTHVTIKPKGTIKTGEPIKGREFDIRRLKGKAIKELSEKELEKSKLTNPSPERHPPLHH